MLEILSAISKKLYWSKSIAMLAGFVFASLFIASILDIGSFGTDAILIPSMLGGLWSAIYYILLTLFPSVPLPPGKHEKFFNRIKYRFQRGTYYLLGLIFIFLTIAFIYLSFKLFGIWRVEY